MAKAPKQPSTAVAAWEDPGALSTEHDNAIVNEMLGAFRNLDTIQLQSGLPYLGLDRGGDWKYGQESTEPEPGSYWAMDLPTAKWGYVAWVDGKPAGEQMVSIAEPRPHRNTLDAGLPWSDQVSIEMVCVSGEDKGTRVLYKTSSVGGVKCFMAYKDACKRAIPNEPTKPIAVVQLGTSSYKHSKYGEITNPVFEIAGWASIGIVRGNGSAEDEGGKQPPPASPPQDNAPSGSGRRRRVAA